MRRTGGDYRKGAASLMPVSCGQIPRATQTHEYEQQKGQGLASKYISSDLWGLAQENMGQGYHRSHLCTKYIKR